MAEAAGGRRYWLLGQIRPRRRSAATRVGWLSLAETSAPHAQYDSEVEIVDIESLQRDLDHGPVFQVRRHL